MKTSMIRRAALICAFGVAASGCSTLGALGGLGTLGEVLGGVIGGPGGSQHGTVQAEIQQVETRRQLIHIRTQQGQAGAVAYDGQTIVVYRQQQYPVTALEAGDIVNLHVQQDARGEYLTRRIDVVQSVREQGRAGGVQQLAGRIGQIDHNRGVFELQTQHSGVLIVALPFNPPAATVDRFRRLRTGDSVGIEGELVGNNRVELRRFL